MHPPSPGEIDVEVRRLVADVLRGYPAESATVEDGWNERAGMWFVQVMPARKDAAFISIGFDGDDLLTVVVGSTWFELFPVRSVADLGELRAIVEAVAAGSVEESGMGGKKFARISTSNGPITVGAMRIPWPWGFRHARQYAPYGTDSSAT